MQPPLLGRLGFEFFKRGLPWLFGFWEWNRWLFDESTFVWLLVGVTGKLYIAGLFSLFKLCTVDWRRLAHFLFLLGEFF
jgi:hypothetical protein